jgi:hypothetical protein
VNIIKRGPSRDGIGLTREHKRGHQRVKPAHEEKRDKLVGSVDKGDGTPVHKVTPVTIAFVERADDGPLYLWGKPRVRKKSLQNRLEVGHEQVRKGLKQIIRDAIGAWSLARL